MPVSPQQYQQMVRQSAPKTRCARNCLRAFWVGGLLCCLGQVFYDWVLVSGQTQKAASSVASLVLIFLSSLLTALGVFDKIGGYAGAGTLVPITGFANSVVSAGMEFRSEGLIFGTGGKIFNIAGPVVVYGTLFSSLYGFILFLLGK